MHEAAEFGHDDTIRFLLQYGADPNAREGIEHYTPLHEAALHGHLDACKTLIHAGALVNAHTTSHPIDGHGGNITRESKGKTPLQLTSEPFRSEFVEVILPQRLP